MDRSAATTWEAALGQLEVQVTRPNFDTWLRDTVGLRHEGQQFVIGVASDFAIEWLKTRLKALISRTLTQLLGDSVSIAFEVRGLSPLPDQPPVANGHHLPAPRPACLNPELTFATFSVADCNQLGQHAAQQLARGEANFKLLLLWGEPGLGKTHLLHAIAHAALARGCRVQLTTSEQFVNDFVHALSNHSTNSFRARHRDCQLLLLDEFDLLATKAQTQEQFYHLLNHLSANGRSVALALREPPGQLAGLSPGLQSRLHSGLPVELHHPSFTDRLSILQHKSSRLHYHIPTNVLQAIARRPFQQITELEGALNRVVTYAELTGAPPSIKDLHKALDPFQPAPKPPSPNEILHLVAQYFQISHDDLISSSRTTQLTRARHIAIYLIRNLVRCSLTQSAAFVGRKDHSTALHAIAQINDDLKTDSSVRADIQHLYDQLQRSA